MTARRRTAAALVCAMAFTAGAGDTQAREPTTIKVLSDRADLISGGEALVAVRVPRRARDWKLTLRLGRRNVTRAIGFRSGRRVLALVKGLKRGQNVLIARLPDGSGARLRLRNHPNGGPVFSGPQIQPWICEKGAVDKQCNKPAAYHYIYMSTDRTKGFRPYDRRHPPSDVAATTTDRGLTVPFIVRIETGYQDRDQYKIATLYRPGKRWKAWAPQRQWNRKLVITHGASCGDDFGAYSAPSVTSYNPGSLVGLPQSSQNAFADGAVYALGAGFAVLSTDLDNNGDNCNIVVQAESLVMAKERLTERYGPIRYTIGIGCSGGSLTQQQVANAYPGIYQGILPTCSFPDTWSSATQVSDYHLLNAYFGNHSKWGAGIAWTPAQMAAVEGNALPVNSIVTDNAFFLHAAAPAENCWPLKNGPETAKLIYDPKTNPGGVRCGIADYTVNVFGRRAPRAWTPQEKKIGHGFAGLALDNVGVEYGLSALRQGQITPAQFVDLNTQVGGITIDAEVGARRLRADQPALRNAYRSGAINETNNLDRVAIIDGRGPDPGAAHDSYRAFAIRARLDREHGSHANQVIWEGPVAIIGDTQYPVQSLVAMNRWLSAVDKDHRKLPLARKIGADRPAGLHDQCSDGNGHKVSDGLCPPGVVPVYGTPRTVAGDAITTDAQKCRLRPLAQAGHGPFPFLPAQWAQLKTLFGAGVCDFSRPGVSQRHTIPWLTYQKANGRVIYGGRPLQPAPRSVPFEP